MYEGELTPRGPLAPDDDEGWDPVCDCGMPGWACCCEPEEPPMPTDPETPLRLSDSPVIGGWRTDKLPPMLTDSEPDVAAASLRRIEPTAEERAAAVSRPRAFAAAAPSWPDFTKGPILPKVVDPRINEWLNHLRETHPNHRHLTGA